MAPGQSSASLMTIATALIAMISISIDVVTPALKRSWPRGTGHVLSTRVHNN